MIDYIGLDLKCRSRFIANYFGDNTSMDCGTCDNCLARKRKEISPDQFKSIEEEIRNVIDKGVSVQQILTRLKKRGYRKSLDRSRFSTI